VDSEGTLHRQGIMRLATANDEFCVQKHSRVQADPAYAALVMLARVITQLDQVPVVTPELLERLFTRDLAYLREFYNRINQQGNALIPVQCPHCRSDFNVELALAGEL
jgi:hypothetical protein